MVRSALQELCEAARSCSGVALPIPGISLSITNFGMDVFSSRVRAGHKTCDQASPGHYWRKRKGPMKGDKAKNKCRPSVAREASVCQLTRVLGIRLVGAQRGLQVRIGFARCELSFVWLTLGFENQGQGQICAANIARQDVWILPVFKKFDRAPGVGYGLLPLSTLEFDAGFAHQKSRKKGRALPDSSNGGLID